MKRLLIALVFLFGCNDPLEYQDKDPVELDTFEVCQVECTRRCDGYCMMIEYCFDGGVDFSKCSLQCKFAFESRNPDQELTCLVNCNAHDPCEDWIACVDDCEK